MQPYLFLLAFFYTQTHFRRLPPPRCFLGFVLKLAVPSVTYTSWCIPSFLSFLSPPPQFSQLLLQHPTLQAPFSTVFQPSGAFLGRSKINISDPPDYQRDQFICFFIRSNSDVWAWLGVKDTEGIYLVLMTTATVCLCSGCNYPLSSGTSEGWGGGCMSFHPSSLSFALFWFFLPSTLTTVSWSGRLSYQAHGTLAASSNKDICNYTLN